MQDAYATLGLIFQALACETVKLCKNTPSIEREFNLRSRISDLGKFLNGKINSNELRMPEVRTFLEKVRAGFSTTSF